MSSLLCPHPTLILGPLSFLSTILSLDENVNYVQHLLYLNFVFHGRLILFALVYLMVMHIMSISICTTLIFKRYSIHSWVLIEIPASFCQLFKSVYRSSLLPLLLACLSLHIQSIFCQLLCPISLGLLSFFPHCSIFIFCLLTLFRFLYSSFVSH